MFCSHSCWFRQFFTPWKVAAAFAEKLQFFLFPALVKRRWVAFAKVPQKFIRCLRCIKLQRITDKVQRVYFKRNGCESSKNWRRHFICSFLHRTCSFKIIFMIINFPFPHLPFQGNFKALSTYNLVAEWKHDTSPHVCARKSPPFCQTDSFLNCAIHKMQSAFKQICLNIWSWKKYLANWAKTVTAIEVSAKSKKLARSIGWVWTPLHPLTFLL